MRLFSASAFSLALRYQSAYRRDGLGQRRGRGVRQSFAQPQRAGADRDKERLRRSAIKPPRQVEQRRWVRGVDKTRRQRRCALDLTDNDNARLDVDRGIDEDDQFHRGNTFGQFRRQLMANDCMGANDGSLVRKRLGNGLSDPVIASQRIAVTNNERFSGHGCLVMVRLCRQCRASCAP
jgi:hypothetical protein